MPVPGAYLDFPTAWRHFVDTIPLEDRDDVVKGLAKAFAAPPQTDADRERLVKAALACVAWESSASRLNRDEDSHGQPKEKYALTAARILIHYMINGGFLGANDEVNRDNNYIIDHIARLRDIPVNVVHGSLRPGVPSLPGRSPRARLAPRRHQRGHLFHPDGRRPHLRDC